MSILLRINEAIYYIYNIKESREIFTWPIEQGMEKNYYIAFQQWLVIPVPIRSA